MKLVLAVNFKVYESAFGARAVDLAREAGLLASRFNRVRIIVAAPALSASRILQAYDDVYLQHVDPIGFGAYTGFTPLEALKIEGVKGSIVNHSEHKITFRDLEIIARKAGELGLEILACADTPQEAAAVAQLKPTMIAVEPPELIGTGTPVSRAKPEVITLGVEAVKRIADIPVLAGAGITEAQDAVRAVELGAQGVLVASAIMKAKNPQEKLREFTEALATI